MKKTQDDSGQFKVTQESFFSQIVATLLLTQQVENQNIIMKIKILKEHTIKKVQNLYNYSN